MIGLNHGREIDGENPRNKTRVKMTEHLKETQWCFILSVAELYDAGVLFKPPTRPPMLGLWKSSLKKHEAVLFHEKI